MKIRKKSFLPVSTRPQAAKQNKVERRLYLRSRTSDQKDLPPGTNLCRRFPSDAVAVFAKASDDLFSLKDRYLDFALGLIKDKYR